MKKLANYIVAELKKHGFIIQRYDAFSSKSIYLKFDYGVCNSLRISDHRGKKHLAYRYNVLKDVRVSYEKKEKGFMRQYFSFDDVDALIQAIVANRDEKIEKYGTALYQRFMQKNQEEKSDSLGFWKDAKRV